MKVKKGTKKLILIISVILLIPILIFADIRYNSFENRFKRSFNSLSLPSSFVLVEKQEKAIGGDLITSPMAGEARVYKVSMNMEEAKNVLLTIMEKGEDENIGKDDIRIHMHEGNFKKIDDFISKCHPATIPIKSGNTLMYVQLSESEIKDILFDETAHGFTSVKWYDDKCPANTSETYVLISMWAM